MGGVARAFGIDAPALGVCALAFRPDGDVRPGPKAKTASSDRPASTKTTAFKVAARLRRVRPAAPEDRRREPGCAGAADSVARRAHRGPSGRASVGVFVAGPGKVSIAYSNVTSSRGGNGAAGGAGGLVARALLASVASRASARALVRTTRKPTRASNLAAASPVAGPVDRADTDHQVAKAEAEPVELRTRWSRSAARPPRWNPRPHCTQGKAGAARAARAAVKRARPCCSRDPTSPVSANAAAAAGVSSIAG